jgi:hypothetical protein
MSSSQRENEGDLARSAPNPAGGLGGAGSPPMGSAGALTATLRPMTTYFRHISDSNLKLETCIFNSGFSLLHPVEFHHVTK